MTDAPLPPYSITSEEHPNAAVDKDGENTVASSDVEKGSTVTDNGLILDQHGMPLVPQPSRFKDDPLNWSRRLKWLVLIQVSIMAFLGPFNAGLINPGLMMVARAMHKTPKVAAYSTTLAIIMGGISPFLWAPIANVYGRRPVTLLAILMTAAGEAGSGASPNFSALLANRALAGFGFGGMMWVGTAVINDIFFENERGEKTGVYTIFVTNGAHVAALIGGYLGQKEGWQWDYYLGSFITAACLVVAAFGLPETLFCRDPQFLSSKTHERTYSQMLWDFRGNAIPGRKLRKGDFLQSFYMLKYPSITLPFWYYTWAWTFINVLPAISLAAIYARFYHLRAGPVGICLGVSLCSGSLLGEICAGRASDYIGFVLAKRNGNVRKPEHRLYLSTLSAIFMPVGVITFGACVGKTGYIGPLVGLAIGVFGLQIASTCLYAYISDCYKAQSSESGVLFNLSRGLSFCVGFFAIPYAEKVGFFWAWFTFASIIFVSFIPVGALIIWGERWRVRLGPPKFHQYM
ncbi:major facilitator superfamily domain-containing protein [Xylogone sp. PMI_703]|nr:major facilitator superfamily domain-containing protein [Xylogone sp. PMI_703]